jgi:Ser/Thr protein kinase RdoA (MazF antagonist)
VTIPDGGGLLDPPWVERVVHGLAGWPFGPLRVVDVTRIGVEYGLSGQVHRVAASTADRDRVTFIIKQDSVAAAERALLFHDSMGRPLRGSIPDCYGGVLDTATGVGVLFLEDIAPAVQGDVLIDPGDEAAEAAIQVIARVHALSLAAQAGDHAAALPHWHADVWDADRWSERLAGARARFPEVLTHELDRRLEGLPGELGDAIAALRSGPASWIHTDAHLDNILWRPDGSAVLLDWAGAVIGPPAVDAARFIIEGPPGVAADERRGVALIETYQRELVARGVQTPVASGMSIAVGQAMLPLAQSIIGWAGRHDLDPPAPRWAALRENAVRNIASWLSH